MSEKLLPCPFCGGKAALRYDGGNDRYPQSWDVVCDVCRVAFPASYGSSTWKVDTRLDELAMSVPINAWNRRAQPEAAQAGWQPIETAPKDGTWFLAYEGPNGDRDRHEFAVVRPEECACCPRPNFWVNTGGRLFPTHWMPLPEPPAALDRARKGGE